MGRMKDIAIDIASYEMGELSPDETLELFAVLVKSGMVWSLQGSYGRTANVLISAGLLSPEGEVSEFADEMLEEMATT